MMTNVVQFVEDGTRERKTERKRERKTAREGESQRQREREMLVSVLFLHSLRPAQEKAYPLIFHVTSPSKHCDINKYSRKVSV